MSARVIMAVIAFAALIYGATTFDGIGRLVMLIGAIAAALRVAYEVLSARREGPGARPARR